MTALSWPGSPDPIRLVCRGMVQSCQAFACIPQSAPSQTVQQAAVDIVGGQVQLSHVLTRYPEPGAVLVPVSAHPPHSGDVQRQGAGDVAARGRRADVDRPLRCLLFTSPGRVRGRSGGCSHGFSIESVAIAAPGVAHRCWAGSWPLRPRRRGLAPGGVGVERCSFPGFVRGCPAGSRKSAATVHSHYPAFSLSARAPSSSSRCAISIQRCW